MKNFGLIFLLLFCVSLCAQDCKLYELEFSKSACDTNKYFSVKINFAHQNTSNCFSISGNGINYGTFQYSQLPITIDSLIGDCHTEYEFEMIDCHNHDCRLVKELGKVCCDVECSITDFRFERTQCDAHREFYVYLFFTHNGPSECFRILGNGKNYGEFKYSAVPLKLGPFSGDCSTEYEFVVVDCVKEACRASVVVGKVCCEMQSECVISNLRFEKTQCDAEKNFYVYLNFDFKGNSECFKVRGNGHEYGTFKYNQLPLKLGPFKADCSTEYEFVVVDCVKEACRASIVVGKVCCEMQSECVISNLRFEKTQCDAEKNFYVYLNFDFKGNSECFKVRGNGHEYGTFKYNQLPIKLGPFKADCSTEYEFVVVDCVKEACRASVVVGKVCCEMQTTCKISDLNIIKSKCGTHKLLFISINFTHVNTMDSFYLLIPGLVNSKKFAYSQLPLQLGPFEANCNKSFELLIKDHKKNECSAAIEIGKLCCESTKEECKLSELSVSTLDCTGPGQYGIKINFKYQGTKGLGFDVFSGGKAIGFYKYTQLPLIIPNFIASGKEVDHIEICENDRLDCCVSKEFKALKCFGIGKFKLDEVSIYQSQQKIIIESKQAFPEDFAYKIYDINGKKVLFGIVPKLSSTYQIEIQGLQSGVYILKIDSGTETKNKRFYVFN